MQNSWTWRYTSLLIIIIIIIIINLVCACVCIVVRSACGSMTVCTEVELTAVRRLTVSRWLTLVTSLLTVSKCGHSSDDCLEVWSFQWWRRHRYSTVYLVRALSKVSELCEDAAATVCWSDATASAGYAIMMMMMMMMIKVAVQTEREHRRNEWLKVLLCSASGWCKDSENNFSTRKPQAAGLRWGVDGWRFFKLFTFTL